VTRKWPTVSLGEVANLIGGGTPSKANTTYWSGNIPWASVRDMKERWLSSTEFSITDSGVRESATNVIPAGNVVIATRVGLGKVVQLEKSTAINQDLRAIVPKSESTLDPAFIYYWYQTVVSEVISAGTGATVQGVKIPTIASLQIPLPPLAEQKRIVAKLDEAMNLIRFLVLKISETNKLVSDFMSTNRDERLRPASNWKIKPLEDIAKFIDYRGRTPVKTESGVPLITAKNVKMGFLQDEPREYIDASDYEHWMSRGIPVSGDILITTEAPLGNIAQLETSGRVAFAQRVIVLQVDRSQVAPDFVKQALLSKHLQNPIQSQATGATAMGIKASLLRKIPISFPSSLEEQQSISDAVSTSGKIVESRKLLDQTKQQEIAILKSKILAAAFAGEL
jgi:type I restriction enzyme S subunit